VLDVHDAPAPARQRRRGERRRQATHPANQKPELLATGPGQVWSWDITKLRGPGRGIGFQLYVVLDIFSRYVVAWTVQAVEDSGIAKTMLEEAMGVHGIPEAVHADRGTSKPVAQLLLDLGVDRSHSRPRVANDNPYSEAAFKTLKYAPVFPDAFGSLADARTFCEAFFGYYNHEHRHSGIGLHTPASVHHGRNRDPRPAAAHPRRSPRCSPRAVRQPPTPGTEAAQGSLDQPALTGGPSYIPYGRAMSFVPPEVHP
jgi:putative transposase